VVIPISIRQRFTESSTVWLNALSRGVGGGEREMAIIGYDVFYIQHKMTVDKLISLGLLLTGGGIRPKIAPS
jgi:hypothetical protein